MRNGENTSSMRNFSRTVLGEVLFWSHLAFIACAILSGLALPLLVVVAAIVVHRLHMIAFDGCVLSAIERWVGTLPRDLTFLQHASRRLSGRTISPLQSVRLDQCFVASCLALAVARHVLVR